MSADGGSWASYLEQFHESNPGITETVLGRARVDGIDPYRWLADAVPSEARRSGAVLDLACGSAPMRHVLPMANWFGADRSPAELRRANTAGDGPLIRADADALPVPSRTIDAVVCSMALMIVAPLEEVLAEVARVLRPGGSLVALVPAESPVTILDRLRHLHLLLALRRRRFDYPNRLELDRPSQLFAVHGLSLEVDERRRFVTPLDPEHAELLVRSLYLPGTTDARIGHAVQVARSWRHGGVGIPLRRLVWRREHSQLRDVVRRDTGAR